MKKFMIIRKADEETEAGAMPSEQLVSDMMRYNEQLVEAGMMIGGDGLHPTSNAARIRFHNGAPTVIDGPFTEAKELIAGYTLVQANSRDEVIEWAKRWPASDAHGNVQLEIRQVYTVEDFGEAFSPEMRELEEQLRTRSEELAKGTNS
ncbi:MAG TPA: YciI family protein [Thermoanaerobaculia bacterium]|nr:YciI family protein [Thermoanaerobaculia bacterium]